EVKVDSRVADGPLPCGLVGARRGQPVVVQPDLVVLLALQGQDTLLLQLLLDLALLLDPLILPPLLFGALLLDLLFGRALVGSAEILHALVLHALVLQALVLQALVLQPLGLQALLLLELLNLRGRGDGADPSDWSDCHGSHNLRLPLDPARATLGCEVCGLAPAATRLRGCLEDAQADAPHGKRAREQ